MNNENLAKMQVEHEELEVKIKRDEEQLVAKREEYLKFNKAGFYINAQRSISDWPNFIVGIGRQHPLENQSKRKEQFALAQGELEALKEELHERTEHLAQLKIKVSH